MMLNFVSRGRWRGIAGRRSGGCLPGSKVLLLLFCSWGTELQWVVVGWGPGGGVHSLQWQDQTEQLLNDPAHWASWFGHCTLHHPGHMPLSPRPQLHPHTLASASLNLRGVFPWIYSMHNLNSKSPSRFICLPTNPVLSELWNVVSYLLSFYGLDLGTDIQQNSQPPIGLPLYLLQWDGNPILRTVPFFQNFLSEILFLCPRVYFRVLFTFLQ